MKERDYIIATNLAKIRMAKECLWSTLGDDTGGKEWGISGEQRCAVLDQLDTIEGVLAKKVKT